MGGAILVFGWVYFETGRDLVRHRPFLLVSAGAKLLFVLVAGTMTVLHAELRPVAPPLLGDLVFGALFLRDYLRTGDTL